MRGTGSVSQGFTTAAPRPEKSLTLRVTKVAKGIAILPVSKRPDGLQEWLDGGLRPWFEGRMLPVPPQRFEPPLNLRRGF